MDERDFINSKNIKEYRDFAFREDMMKFAVGVILGNSFNKVINGISDYLLMPIFKFLVSKTGDGWRNWAFIPFNGLEFEVGRMIGVLVDFILISFILYLICQKGLGRLKRKEEPIKGKKCEYCCKEIDPEAKKCPYCTSDITLQTLVPQDH
jgi:large conductance mechanosensitive channel